MNFVTNILKKYMQNDPTEEIIMIHDSDESASNKENEIQKIIPVEIPATTHLGACGTNQQHSKPRVSFLKEFDPLYSDSPKKGPTKTIPVVKINESEFTEFTEIDLHTAPTIEYEELSHCLLSDENKLLEISETGPSLYYIESSSKPEYREVSVTDIVLSQKEQSTDKLTSKELIDSELQINIIEAGFDLSDITPCNITEGAISIFKQAQEDGATSDDESVIENSEKYPETLKKGESVDKTDRVEKLTLSKTVEALEDEIKSKNANFHQEEQNIDEGKYVNETGVVSFQHIGISESDESEALSGGYISSGDLDRDCLSDKVHSNNQPENSRPEEPLRKEDTQSNTSFKIPDVQEPICEKSELAEHQTLEEKSEAHQTSSNEIQEDSGESSRLENNLRESFEEDFLHRLSIVDLVGISREREQLICPDSLESAEAPKFTDISAEDNDFARGDALKETTESFKKSESREATSKEKRICSESEFRVVNTNPDIDLGIARCSLADDDNLVEKNYMDLVICQEDSLKTRSEDAKTLNSLLDDTCEPDSVECFSKFSDSDTSPHKESDFVKGTKAAEDHKIRRHITTEQLKSDRSHKSETYTTSTSSQAEDTVIVTTASASCQVINTNTLPAVITTSISSHNNIDAFDIVAVESINQDTVRAAPIDSVPSQVDDRKIVYAGMADLSEKLIEQQQENAQLKLQLNASQQAKASLELEIRQKEEIVFKTQAEALRNEQLYKQELKLLKEQLMENTKIIEKKDDTKELEEQLNEAKIREARALAELNERDNSNSNYMKMIEEYQQLMKARIGEYQKLKEEHETIKTHLTNLELAFSDVHSKYEKTKELLQECKSNEEALILSLEIAQTNNGQLEERYESLKTHAKTQIDKSNKENCVLKEQYESEISKLKAIIKRLEIKCSSLEISLQQKAKECEELSALCEEVTGKKV